MTCKKLIESIVNDPNQNGYDMEKDDPRKLIAIAYYMGRESADREVSDMYNAHLARQRKRAEKCRYYRMALDIVGPERYLYSPDYAGDMTAIFGSDETSQTKETLSK